MTATWTVLRAEAYRIWYGRLWIVGLVALAAVAALRVIAERVSVAAAHATAVQEALSSGRPTPEAVTPNAYGPFVDGWLAGLTVATLLLLILSARGLASDAQDGLLRIATTRSTPRGALVTGRVLLGLPLALGALVVTGLAAYATSAALFAFGPIVEDGYTLVSVSEIHAEITSAALAVAPAMFAAWCFGLFVSSASRTGTTGVSVVLAVFLAFDLFKDVLGDAQYWAFASFCPSFVDSSAMGEAALAARGFSDAGFPAHVASLNSIVPLPQAMLFVVGAVLVMRRRGL